MIFLQELFVVFTSCMADLANNEYFIYVVASMAVCGVCGLITSLFRSDV